MTDEERKAKNREKARRYRDRHPERAREARRRCYLKRRASIPPTVKIKRVRGFVVPPITPKVVALRNRFLAWRASQ